jgi:integrase
MRRLIDAAAQVDPRTHALVLVGLHGALRRGEILGLEWEDVNLARRQLVVRRNVISRYMDTPKSGHGRVVELLSEPLDALTALKEGSSWKTGRVFRQDSGRPALARHLYAWMEVATARADIPRRRGAQASRDAAFGLLGPRLDGREATRGFGFVGASTRGSR